MHYDTAGDREQWVATSAELTLYSDDPLALLGLAAMRETREPKWKAADQEIDAIIREYKLDEGVC